MSETNEPQDDDVNTSPEEVPPQSEQAQATDAAMEDEQPVEVAEPESRDEEMMRLRRETQEAEKRALQAQAEAENFRKRMRRDYEEQIKFAPLPLVTDMLQVRDNLIRAIEAAETAEDVSGLKEGVSMVAKQLDDTLSKHGIREIPAAGELFDPNFHEAISQMPSPDHPSGTVAHVAVTGFQMHERVVRPSQVVVSTGDGESG